MSTYQFYKSKKEKTMCLEVIEKYIDDLIDLYNTGNLSTERFLELRKKVMQWKYAAETKLVRGKKKRTS